METKKWSLPPHPHHYYHSRTTTNYHHHSNGTSRSSTNGLGIRKDKVRLKCIVLGAAGAGKTSILRRLVHNTFDPHRDSTLGADFYTYRIKNPLLMSDAQKQNGNSGSSDGWEIREKENKEKFDNNPNDHCDNNRPSPSPRTKIDQQYISLQLWDTAGKERNLKSKKTEKNNHRGRVPSLGDAFFRNADVAMLVYDATSSVSFMQLIRWHSELIARLNECSYEGNNATNDGNFVSSSGNNKCEEVRGSSSSRSINSGVGYNNDSNNNNYNTKMIPVLVVANKLDRVRMEMSKPIRRKIVPQRDVMGLKGKFRGKDCRYEYSAAGTSPHQQQQTKPCGDNKKTNNGSSEALTYNMTDSVWTTDYSYLNSVMTAEDGSMPDQDMVSLWCRRNGLQHVEVSALDGTGLDHAIQLLVTQALESVIAQQKQQRQQQQKIQQELPPPQQTSDDEFTDEQHLYWTNEISSFHHRKGQPLDFHERYRTKDENRLCWGLLTYC